jgi:hypothetical protein
MRLFFSIFIRDEEKRRRGEEETRRLGDEVTR